VKRIWRSLLFVPANNRKMINNALKQLADAVILDLEDAVSFDDKEAGRICAQESIPLFKDAEIDVFVRVNQISGGLTEQDISYIAFKELTGIVLPKAETEQDVRVIAGMLSSEEEKRGLADKIKILPLIESPKGIENVMQIVAASPRVIGVAFGAGDFLREMGVGFAVTRLSAREYYPAILYARSKIAVAAKIAGIDAIDTPYFGPLTDIEGLLEESQAVKLLGFTGKQIIHPRQIDPVNNTFSPSVEDIAYAKALVDAYEEARSKGLGSVSFQGRMIDLAMYKMAVDMIVNAEKIADRENAKLKKL
jgi:citrate lyase subunit beta / citryl-CoA lyase